MQSFDYFDDSTLKISTYLHYVFLIYHYYFISITKRAGLQATKKYLYYFFNHLRKLLKLLQKAFISTLDNFYGKPLIYLFLKIFFSGKMCCD